MEICNNHRNLQTYFTFNLSVDNGGLSVIAWSKPCKLDLIQLEQVSMFVLRKQKNDKGTNNEPEVTETEDNWVSAYGTEGKFMGLNKNYKSLEI